MNGGASGNLAVPASYVRRPVEIDTGELASPQPAEVDDVRDREVVTSGVFTFSREATSQEISRSVGRACNVCSADRSGGRSRVRAPSRPGLLDYLLFGHIRDEIGTKPDRIRRVQA